MTIYNGDKIKELRELYNLSQQELSDKTLIPKGRINGWEQNNRTPKLEDYAIIETFFKNIENIGSQIKRPFVSNIRPIKFSEDAEIYANRFGVTFEPLEDDKYLMGTPLLPHYVKGGPMAGFADPEYFEELPKHYSIVDRIYRGKYFSSVMMGESMDYEGRDYIAPNAIITYRELKKELWVHSKLHLNGFKDFVIETEEGLQVKRIIKHDLENYIITCHSLNPDKQKYPDFKLNLNEVLNIFNVIKVENPR